MRMIEKTRQWRAKTSRPKCCRTSGVMWNARDSDESKHSNRPPTSWPHEVYGVRQELVGPRNHQLDRNEFESGQDAHDLLGVEEPLLMPLTKCMKHLPFLRLATSWTHREAALKPDERQQSIPADRDQFRSLTGDPCSSDLLAASAIRCASTASRTPAPESAPPATALRNSATSPW